MKSKINSKISLGEIGETAGEKYLSKKGYRLVEKNFRCRSGELDLLFMDGDTLVAVEVKSRKNLHYGLPCEAITNTKKKHIISSLYSYVAFKGLRNRNLRIDVLEIYLNSDNEVEKINHIEDAI